MKYLSPRAIIAACGFLCFHHVVADSAGMLNTVNVSTPSRVLAEVVEVTEDQKLLMSGGTAIDSAGRRIALHGNTLVISAYREDIEYIRQGAAYVYEWTGSMWEFSQKLVSPTPGPREAFGTSVAVEGDTLIAGNRGDMEYVFDGGAAWVYKRIGGVWTLSQKIVPADVSNDLDFGVSVEISGDLLVVGGRNNIDAIDSGVLYVYQYDTESEEYVYIQKIVPDEVVESYQFALWDAVAISGTTLAVGGEGAPNAAGARVGAVHVYEFEEGEFQEKTKLMLEDGAEGEKFGGAVAIDGDFILVGAELYSAGSGGAFVYSSSAPYDLMQSLTPEGQEADHRFGCSVKSDSGGAVIGGKRGNGVNPNTGVAHFFVLDAETNLWVERVKMIASDGARQDGFSEGIAVVDGLVAVGAVYDDNENGFDAGGIYTYDLSEYLSVATSHPETTTPTGIPTTAPSMSAPDDTPAPTSTPASDSHMFFGTSGDGTVDSTLYSFSLLDSTATQIGDVEYAGEKLRLESMAFDRSSGELYASTSTSSPYSSSLFLIDTSTADASLIGAFAPTRNMAALAFDASGQLYGWSDTGADRLVLIDKMTATVVLTGDFTYATGKAGLSFDDAGTLYLLERKFLYVVDPETGEAVEQGASVYSPFYGHRGDIEPGTRFFYQTERIRNGSVKVVDVDTLEVDHVVETGIDGLFLLAFGF